MRTRTNILAALLGPGLAGLSNAAVLTVPDTYPSISDAVQASEPGDTILVGPGTWEEAVNYAGKDIAIVSLEGPGKTSIIGERTAVQFRNRETTAAVLEGFTITGGIGLPYLGSNVGGGIYVFESSPTIQNCIIENCNADFGAGMHIALGSPVIVDCTFRNNTSISNGGAVRIHDKSFPTFTNCQFIMNHTNDFGGGIAYGNDSTGTHDNCNFDGNTADIRGGAIYLGCSCSDAQVSGSDFCNSIPDHIVGAWSDNGGNEWCPVCEDDINADGVVGIDDLLAVISAWGSCVCIEDINGDTVVDVTDLLLVIQDWGTCPG